MLARIRNKYLRRAALCVVALPMFVVAALFGIVSTIDRVLFDNLLDITLTEIVEAWKE
jgi:hypothetical protein